MLKKVAPYLIFFIVAGLMILVRVMVGANTEFAAGQKAFDQGKAGAAIHHFDRSIHWYFPGSSAVEKSVLGLKQIAGTYEEKGDVQGALYAWRILRSALYSARHISQPYKETIAFCDDKISDLMALAAGEKGSQEFETERALRHKQLTQTKGPKTFYALLAEAGFFGWIISALLFIWLGIKPGKGFEIKRAALFSGLFVIFYALWIFGLAKA